MTERAPCLCGCGGYPAKPQSKHMPGHHNYLREPAPLRPRLFSQIIINRETGCLLWTGVIAKNGYGRVGYGGRDYLVHRLMYELFVGPIPDGLEIDHLCRVRQCASPAHLEAVTSAENTRRGVSICAIHAAKTHCKRGHEFTPENIYVQPSRPSGRRCRTCMRAWEATRRRAA